MPLFLPAHLSSTPPCLISDSTFDKCFVEFLVYPTDLLSPQLKSKPTLDLGLECQMNLAVVDIMNGPVQCADQI